MPAHCTSIRVRYADTDQGRVVYHGNYVPWFESGRTEAMRTHGIPYVELEGRGIHLPVIDMHVRYHRPALYDDIVEVWAHVVELTRTRVQFGYELRRQGDAQLLATGHTIHTFLGDDGHVVRMDRHPELWVRIQAAAEQLRKDGD